MVNIRFIRPQGILQDVSFQSKHIVVVPSSAAFVAARICNWAFTSRSSGQWRRRDSWSKLVLDLIIKEEGVERYNKAATTKHIIHLSIPLFFVVRSLQSDGRRRVSRSEARSLQSG
jgi:hypothetical protein